MSRWLAAVVLAACGGADIAPPAPAPVDPSPAPTTPAAPPCAPLPEGVVARAPFDGRELVVAGAKKGTVKSDEAFDLLDAELWLVDGKCSVAHAAIGELTHFGAELTITVQSSGAIDGNIGEAVAIERAKVGARDVLLVYLKRDVQFGETLFFLTPVTLQGGELLAGSRVPIGRDAMGPPQFYSRVSVTGDALAIAREGAGSFPGPLELHADASGAFIAK
jgi:hypothetical protein